MQCWVCKRDARGFGHADTRYRVGDPRHWPVDWAFCSRRCQDAFHTLYGAWKDVGEGRRLPTEVRMIDATDAEQAAMRACLPAFGEAAGAIGFDRALGSYSEAEALQVIEAIVTAYTEAMARHHEATKYPPVRGMRPVPDPMGVPFADMPGDAPWET